MRRLLARARQELPFLIVIVILGFAAAFLAVEPGHWLRGAGIVALALTVATVGRAVLSPARAGLLAVRGRWFDTLCYGGLASAIVVMGVLLPS